MRGLCLLGAVTGLLGSGAPATRAPQSGPVPVDTASDAEVLRESRRLGAELSAIFMAVERAVSEGVTTKHLNDVAVREILARGLVPYFKGFVGYPAETTIAVNDEIINSVPSERRLQRGDLVKVQIGVRSERAYALRGWTFSVGRPSDRDAALIETARRALSAAVAKVRIGAHTGDVSSTLKNVVEAAGFRVSPYWVGHGIGRSPWVAPEIPALGEAGTGAPFAADAVYSISVIVHAGSPEARVSYPDGWTAFAADHARSVHFTQMVTPTANGPEELIPPPLAGKVAPVPAAEP